MIRKLRWKFSAIMMTIVAFLLAVIFITLYYTTKANYVQRSMGHPAFRHAGKLSGQYAGTGRAAALCGPASSLPPPQAGTSSDGG